MSGDEELITAIRTCWQSLDAPELVRGQELHASQAQRDTFSAPDCLY